MKAGLINVASNSSQEYRILGGRGPVFGDGSFKYIPILEDCRGDESLTYKNLGLCDFLPSREDGDGEDLCAHYDPEFETFTFGDYSKSNGGRITKDLQSFKKGDYLFFLASLDYKDDGSKRKQWVAEKGFYIIGYFKIKEAIKDVEPPLS